MNKFIAIITLFAAASTAKDLHRNGIANDMHLKTVGLRGLAQTQRKSEEDDTIPGLVEAVLNDGSNGIWNLMMIEDDGTNIALEYAIEGRDGQDDEVIAILLDGNDEVQIIDDLKDEQRKKKRPKGKQKTSRSSSIVKWVMKPKKPKKPKKMERLHSRARARNRGTSEDSETVVGMDAKTEKKNRMDTSVSPTPRPTFSFPSLYPTAKVTTKPPSRKPTTDSPTDQPSQNPVTDSTTNQSILKPVTYSPTRKPTQEPTIAAGSLAMGTKTTSAAPPCPLHYKSSTKYTTGDTIEDGLQIYQCQPPSEYCSIVDMVDTWTDAEKGLWSDAWVHVGPCEKQRGDDEMLDAVDDADVVSGDAPITTVVPSSTVFITVGLIACPPVYDPIKTTYIAGEQVTIKCKLFQCRKEHEIYCNAAAWDESLLAQNDGAYKMWMNAWEHLGACVPTQTEFMEADSTDWGCAVADNGATRAQVTTTEIPTTTVATTTAATTTVLPVWCPSAYDPFKTSYIAGEQVTIKCDIFQCRDDHEIYCNAAVWDETLLNQNDRAQEMWMDAWEMLGACVPTQAEYMEEEAANQDWDCLA